MHFSNCCSSWPLQPSLPTCTTCAQQLRGRDHVLENGMPLHHGALPGWQEVTGQPATLAGSFSCGQGPQRNTSGGRSAERSLQSARKPLSHKKASKVEQTEGLSSSRPGEPKGRQAPQFLMNSEIRLQASSNKAAALSAKPLLIGEIASLGSIMVPSLRLTQKISECSSAAAMIWGRSRTWAAIPACKRTRRTSLRPCFRAMPSGDNDGSSLHLENA